MQTRISAVQHALVVLLAAALAIGLIARPAPQNGRLHHALDELAAFRQHFDRPSVEAALLEYARAQGRQPLTDVAAAASSIASVPAVSAATDAPPLQPLATVQLGTLIEVHRFAKPTSTLPIGVADAAALGRALGWRLVRAGGESPTQIERVELQPARVPKEAVALESEVPKLQADYLAAMPAAAAKTKELAAADDLYEARRKWKLPWKVLVKTDEARKQVRAELAEKQRELHEHEQRYEDAVKRTAVKYEAVAIPPLPERAIARVALARGSEHTTLEIPVTIAVRSVPVQSLPGGEFHDVAQAGLWDELEKLDVERAIAAARAHFTWHYRYVELSGIKLGGMTVLQFLPCALPLLLAFSVLRMRAVSLAYNPFGTRVKGRLPRVGFGARLFDLVVVVVLPLAAACCAAASLLLLGQVPALPVLVSVVCLVLGVYTFLKLGELQSLVEDVGRSHSNPPPDDDR